MKRLFLAAVLSLGAPLFSETAVTWTAEAVAPTPTSTVTAIPVPNVTPDLSVIPPSVYAAWHHINLAEAERLHSSSKNLFVDARASAEFDQSHIPRAINIPLGDFEEKFKKHRKEISKAKVIVVYCHGGGCSLSEKETEAFHKHGFKNAICFHGGWPAWHNAKLPEQDRTGKVAYPPATPTAVPAPSSVPEPQPLSPPAQ